MNSKALLVATAALLAMSAVSCGKDDEKESSVSISLSEQQTSTKETSTETVTTATETNISGTTTETTAVSGTESVTTTTEQTSTINSDADVTTTTTIAAETSQAEETNPPEQSEQQQENDTPTEAPAETQAPETQQPTEAPAQSESVKFSMDNLLSDASEIIASLGTPSYSGGGAACLTNGHDDKIYQYDGLEIQCYIDGSTEYIFQINITGGDYETDKGIKIGSTRAEVEAAYGTGTESGNMIVYSSGDNEMDIQYNGDTVASIFFYTPV